jgi:16S rRNA (cytosine967-C5)-methyltransferase
MTLPFREFHANKILETQGDLPFDLHVNRYFRANKALGSKDRLAIGEQVFEHIRWRLLREYEGSAPPPHIQCSMPKELFDILVDEMGEEKALEFGMTCNTKAPLTVRVNTLKVSREELLERWKDFPCQAAALSDVGIIFSERVQLLHLPEYREGFFEIQDEGSQLLAQMAKVQPGDQVLDLCAGSGGKSLAVAPQMEGKGQLYLYDIREAPLREAKKRLRRAGVQNYQVLSDLRRGMDWVIVDAPCSGTGTLRRNVDLKYRLTPAFIDDCIAKQRQLLRTARGLLKPGGQILYGTCSVLNRENLDQVALPLEGEPLITHPTPGGMDGFFGAVLKP